MAKTAKKTAKLAEKKAPKHRTIQDQLDYIELMIATILYVFANAEICVGEAKPAQKKVAKKIIKSVKK